MEYSDKIIEIEEGVNNNSIDLRDCPDSLLHEFFDYLCELGKFDEPCFDKCVAVLKQRDESSASQFENLKNIMKITIERFNADAEVELRKKSAQKIAQRLCSTNSSHRVGNRNSPQKVAICASCQLKTIEGCNASSATAKGVCMRHRRHQPSVRLKKS